MESLYRKYRPQTFADVVGQQHIVSTLERAVTEGRVSHAYLFCGPRGTGKTTMARILAKALLCEHGPSALPDGTCEDCKLIAAGEHPDVYELDAASRTGVDNVREEIIASVDYAPVRGQYKVYIIDEVHMLTPQAFNALLKTLEEPPSHVVFVMCTTDPQKILATILSRVQRFDFHAIGNDEMRAHLADICTKEGFTFEDEALDIVVRHARGGMRDAISTLEQLSVFGSGAIKASDARNLLGEVSTTGMQKTTAALAQRNIATLFNEVAELCNTGHDPLQFTRELAAHIRDLYVVSIAGTKTGVVDANEQELAALGQEAEAFGGPDRLANILTVLGDAINQMRTATNQRLVLEIALTKATRPEGTLTLESLAERIEALENQDVRAAPIAAPVQTQAAAPAPVASVPTAAPAPAPSAPAEKPSPAAAPASTPTTPTPAATPAPASAPAPKPAPVPAAPAPAATSSAPAPQQTTAPQHAPAPTPQPAQPQQTPAVSSQAGSDPVHAAVVRMPSAEESAPRSGGDLQRTWKQVVENLVKASGPYGTLLLNTYAQSDDGNTLSIVIEGSDFALRMLERPDIKLSVNDAVARLFGRRTICYVNGEVPKTNAPASKAAVSADATPAPAVATVPSPAPAPATVPTPAPAPAANPQPTPAPQAVPVPVPQAATPTSPAGTQSTPAPVSAPAAAPQPVPTSAQQAAPVPHEQTPAEAYESMPVDDDDDEFDPSIYDDVDGDDYYDGYGDMPTSTTYDEPAQENPAPTQTVAAASVPAGSEEFASLISDVFEGAKVLPDTTNDSED